MPKRTAPVLSESARPDSPRIGTAATRPTSDAAAASLAASHALGNGSGPLILLCNDDGILSPGLHAAAEALFGLGELCIVAPLHQQTGMGRSFTGSRHAPLIPTPLEIAGRQLTGFAADCSPAMAVRLASHVLHPRRPALLVSGINYGENLAVSVSSSGTIGAAIEGVCLGVPSLAVSLETDVASHFTYTEQDWTPARHFLRLFAERMLAAGPAPQDVDIIKVDIPASATLQTPWRTTRLSRRPYYMDHIENATLESCMADAVLRRNWPPCDDPRSDTWAVRNDAVVSVTPLSVDATSRTPFDSVEAWLGRNS